MPEFTPITPPIRNRKGREMYKNPEQPIPIKLWKKNRDKIPLLVRRFKQKNRNALLNHLIELAEMLFEIEADLKAKGSFNLTAETAKRFGIKI